MRVEKLVVASIALFASEVVTAPAPIGGSLGLTGAATTSSTAVTKAGSQASSQGSSQGNSQGNSQKPSASSAASGANQRQSSGGQSGGLMSTMRDIGSSLFGGSLSSSGSQLSSSGNSGTLQSSQSGQSGNSGGSQGGGLSSLFSSVFGGDDNLLLSSDGLLNSKGNLNSGSSLLGGGLTGLLSGIFGLGSGSSSSGTSGSSSSGSSGSSGSSSSSSGSLSSSSGSSDSHSSSSSDLYSAIYDSHGVNETFARSILDAHNKDRAKHDASPLAWDKDAYNYAKNNADNYDCSGVLTHTHGPFGENLAAGYNSGPAAVKAWYDEGKLYHYGTENTYNHFTQVIWKGSKKVGCAYKDCSKKNWGLYVVCEYDPAGNVIGKESANVVKGST